MSSGKTNNCERKRLVIVAKSPPWPPLDRDDANVVEVEEEGIRKFRSGEKLTLRLASDVPSLELEPSKGFSMSENSRREKKVRLTVDLPPPFYKRLAQLEHLVEASTKANLIRDALKLYETIAKMALDGYEFYAEKDGRQEKIVFLGAIPPT